MSWLRRIRLAIALISWGTVSSVLLLFHGLPPLPESGEMRASVAGAFILGFCGLGLFADWDGE